MSKYLSRTPPPLHIKNVSRAVIIDDALWRENSNTASVRAVVGSASE